MKDVIEPNTWADFKSHLAQFDSDVSKQPWGRMQRYTSGNYYTVLGAIDGIEFTYSTDDATEKSDIDTFVPYMHKYAEDSHGRLAVYQHSGNPDWTTQWVHRGDNCQTNKRNQGNSTLFRAGGGDTDNLMDESIALSNTGDGYHENALNNYVFENQVPLSFYEAEYGGVWKRKRVRICLLDDIQAFVFSLDYEGGRYQKAFVHPFIFIHNKDLGGTGMNPDGVYLPAYDNTQAHNKDTNPVGWCVSTYSEEIPLCFSKFHRLYEPERTSGVIPTDSYGNMAELWLEISYDSTDFATGDPLIGFISAGVYSENNIDKNW